MRIVAVDEIALALGLSPGMALADARARVPGLHSIAYDRAGDAGWLDDLAEVCERFTPSVALDPPDGLILDITGCAHLWDGEAGLVSALAARLVHLGLTLRLALAETPDKARALARHDGDLLRVGRPLPPAICMMPAPLIGPRRRPCLSSPKAAPPSRTLSPAPFGMCGHCRFWRWIWAKSEQPHCAGPG